MALWLTGTICWQTSWADTDVTELFLENWGFDTELNYGTDATGNVEKEIKQVPGWTQDHDVDYTIVGTYAFGTKKTFSLPFIFGSLLMTEAMLLISLMISFAMK